VAFIKNSTTKANNLPVLGGLEGTGLEESVTESVVAKGECWLFDFFEGDGAIITAINC
jgi:hypothetical protein